jgi:vancomycin permeability regulator SanA
MVKIKRLLLIPSIATAGFLFALGVLVVDGLNDRVGRADIALVLGNKVNVDGSPSDRLRARLDKTLELYGAGYFPTIIVSGGTGKEGHDEAKVMRNYLVTNGIPEGTIIMDNAGGNTYASAKNTLQISRKLGKHSVFVISQYFHLPRTRMVLGRLGVSEIYTAHADFFECRDVYSALREVAAYVKYALGTYGE